MFKRLAKETEAAPGTGGGDSQPVDWAQSLVLLFRVLALFQLAKGMVHWGLLITVSDGSGSQEATEYLTANIYFAVLDPVAGVGLWLTSSWGAVLWLLAAVSQIAISLGFPEVYGALWPLIAFEAFAIGVYVFLTWKVAQIAED